MTSKQLQNTTLCFKPQEQISIAKKAGQITLCPICDSSKRFVVMQKTYQGFGACQFIVCEDCFCLVVEKVKE